MVPGFGQAAFGNRDVMRSISFINRLLLGSALLIVMLPGTASILLLGQASGKRTPSVKATPVKVRVKCYPLVSSRIRQTGSPAVIEFEAVSYQPPLKIEAVTENQRDSSSPESAIRGYWTALYASNLEWALKTFAPVDRNRARIDLSDKQTFDRMVAVFKSMQESYITETYMYGEYRILATTSKLKDGGWLNLYSVYKKTDLGWLKSEDLKSDRTASQLFDYIAAQPRKMD